MNGYFSSVVQQALDKHWLRIKPSAYANKWWTADLTALRKAYTRTRNRARALRRQERLDQDLNEEVRRTRQDFHHITRKLK